MPPSSRKNWASLSSTQRQTVINGFLKAKQSGAYDQLVMQHQQAMMGNPVTDWHQKPIFLPVHRWFLTRIEAITGVKIPYWDWSTQQSLPPGLGGDGDPNQGYRVMTGPFANWTVIIWNSTTNTFVPRDQPGLIRQTGVYASGLSNTDSVNWWVSVTPYDASPWDTTVSAFREGVEGMHDGVHAWVGGDMRTGTSPNDPLFWLHHANIDRIWGGWQTRHGTTSYAAPAGQGPNDPMPNTGGTTPSQMFPIPAYDQLP